MLNLTTLTGLTIGQYTLKEQLGAGAMGVVYRAFQPTLQREVAIKVLPPTLASQDGYMERFTREARTAASLEHAHIVPIYDYGTQQDLSYVVMRFLTGGSLAQRMSQRIKDKLPLPSPTEVSQMLRELASALDYAHIKNVVHRDIKAGNIMFDNHGSAYLVDFGIAKLLDNLGLTGSGLAVGTPTHMSPEQWRGEDVTPATDQYALGVVIYELISGHLPFESTTAYALMNKHLNEPPIPLGRFRPELPTALEPVFERVMSKDPRDRFPTVSDFSAAFEQAIQGVEHHQTQFFTFEVRPMRLKADGELSSSFARQMGNSSVSAPPIPDVQKAKNTQIDPEEMKQIRRTINERVNKRKEFAMHLVSFVLIVPMLWLIWGFTGRDGFPWAPVATLAWAAGLIMHALDITYAAGRLGDRMRVNEFEREMTLRGVDMDALGYTEKQKREAIGRLAEHDDDDDDDDGEFEVQARLGRRRRRDRH